MNHSVQINFIVNAEPDQVYSAWLSSEEHSQMTGGTAVIDPQIGGIFTAWDNYIRGTTLELVPGKKIVQSWRSSEFPDGMGDSRVEIEFMAVAGGTQINIRHTSLPPGDTEQHRSGWIDYYANPMRDYFSRKRSLQKSLQKEVSRSSGNAAPSHGLVPGTVMITNVPAYIPVNTSEALEPSKMKKADALPAAKPAKGVKSKAAKKKKPAARKKIAKKAKKTVKKPAKKAAKKTKAKARKPLKKTAKKKK